MGIFNEAASFLCDAHREGVSFQRMLTLGHQSYFVDDKTLKKLAAEQHIDMAQLPSIRQEYAGAFFQHLLKAQEVVALDNSEFEGAALIHDLNTPITSNLYEQFDVVLDGGLLEHVFNFPVAIANCMKMVKTGGRLFIFAPANNMFGHGFYQFSPELFYRVLSSDYGFEVEKMIAVQLKYLSGNLKSIGTQYNVVDPNKIRTRVSLINSHPVILMIQSRKLFHQDDLFRANPQQSDYVQKWNADKEDQHSQTSSLPRSSLIKSALKSVLTMLPNGTYQTIVQEYNHRFIYSFRNRTFFLPVKMRK